MFANPLPSSAFTIPRAVVVQDQRRSCHKIKHCDGFEYFLTDKQQPQDLHRYPQSAALSGRAITPNTSHTLSVERRN